MIPICHPNPNCPDEINSRVSEFHWKVWNQLKEIKKRLKRDQKEIKKRSKRDRIFFKLNLKKIEKIDRFCLFDHFSLFWAILTFLIINLIFNLCINFFDLLIDIKVIFFDLLIKKWLNLITKWLKMGNFNQKEIKNRSNL